jgi:hypothetical protein
MEAKHRELIELLEGEGFAPEEARRLARKLMQKEPDVLDSIMANMRNFQTDYRRRLN